jgi:microsomal dipeptidase-like Zn-dependent dipeptidase
MNSRQTLFLFALIAVLCGGTSANAQAVQGFVDLHSHLTAEHSFGGSWFSGTVEGPMDVAVQRCDGNFPGGSHAATRIPIASELVSGHGLFGGDTGWHLGRRRGYDRRQCRYVFGIPVPGTCPRPHFEDWPMWDAIAHQQMWYGWLQQAYQGGMRVMVVSVAESNFLCNNTPIANRRYDCDEMNSVRRQVNAAQGFVSRHGSWVGIATTPAQARSLIQQGKLALVLAVEVTQLFPSGDFLAQLDELRAMGVRSVQVVHHSDNRFGGAAPIPKLMSGANKVEFIMGESTRINDIVCRDSWGTTGKCNGDNFLNERGLSAEGQTLVRAMMDRGMLVDVAHLSRKSFVNVYQIAQQRGSYPLLYSHAHMWNTISGSEDRHEKFIKQDEIQMITNTGGMVGLRTGPEDATQYGSVSNSCQGSTTAFAQSLMYAVDNGLKVGFGADLNGFTDQLRPRYNSKDCYADYVRINNAGGPTELQKKGLAHVGLLPQLMSELQTVGTPAAYVDHLNQSAENFLKLWERSVSLGSSQSGTWTAWLNRDGSSGSGDWETLSEFVIAGQACSNPIGIECQTTSGVNWTQSGEVYTCDPAGGGICRVADQPDGVCYDYRVRFLCPSGPVNGTFSYSASNTNSAQQNTPTKNVLLSAGQTIQLGTCTVSGSSGSGDTYLRLYGPAGTQVASNDDSCGVLSYLSYTASQAGTYQIRAGCYSGNSCGGTVGYTIQ